MLRPTPPEAGPVDRDERLGEAIEDYLRQAEEGHPPDVDTFVARHPDLADDLRAALDGLELVRGLVGQPGRDARLESGRRIAGYRIVRELGRGGMGVVYEAVHLGLDRPVALKVLNAHAAPNSSGRRRFMNEARTAAGLHHTHIVPVFDVGQVGGLCYFAMQRIEGSGLDRVLRHLRRDRATAAGSTQGSTTTPRRPASSLSRPGDETVSWQTIGADFATKPAGLPPEPDEPGPPFEPPRGSAYYRWVADVGQQAAEALAHAHQRGIIHRDVKPSNLLIDGRGSIWVADFGLARRLADPALTQHDSLLGTPRYMSPEQARTGPVDGRADVYSLGATLYELLTLRPPFEGRTAAELVEQIRDKEPVSPRQFDARVPRDLETIVLKTMAKRPADRYATASDLADDLGRFLNLEPVRARRISPVGRLWRVARRHPGLSAVTTVSAATILAVASFAYVRVVHERDQAVRARSETQDALLRIEAANRETRAAMRRQLWREASVVRLSTVPNRRQTGLGLLKEAATLGPEPDLKTKLRDEAVEFLALRDVEVRPEFPTGRLRSLAFGPEGARLATLSDDGEEFRLWDFATHRPLPVNRLRPDASDAGPGPFGEPAGGRRLARGPHHGLVAAGPHMAVVLPDGQGVRFLDTANGAVLRDVRTPGRLIDGLYATADGQRLVTIESELSPGESEVGRRGEVVINLWGAEPAGDPIATLARWQPDRALPFVPALVAISPDGKTIATARARKTTVALWSSDDGRSLGQLQSPADLNTLTLGPDGLLATAGGGAVQLWDLGTKGLIASLTPSQGFVRMLRFNPAGTLLAAAMGSEVELWDPAAHTAVAVLPASGRVEDLTFSPDGQTLAAAGLGPSTSIWRVVEPSTRVRLSGFDEAPTSSLAFRGDRLLATASWKGTIRFWRPDRCPGNAQVCDFSGGEIDAAREQPRSLAFDARGRLVALDLDALRLWPAPPDGAGSSRIELPGLRGRARFFFSPIARTDDGRSIFLARQGQVLRWRFDRPDQVEALELPPWRPPGLAEPDRERGRFGPSWRALAASPAGDRLYLLEGWSGEIRPLAIDGSRARWLGWTFPKATSLALSPDGATLAVAERSGSIALLDTATGMLRSRLGGPAPGAESEALVRSQLAFAPTGRALAVGREQGPIEFWSLDDASSPLVRLPGHRGRVTALAFAPAGRYLASAGEDKIVDVWDLDRMRNELDRLGLGW